MQILHPFKRARMVGIAAELHPLCCRCRQLFKNIHLVFLHSLVKITPSFLCRNTKLSALQSAPLRARDFSSTVSGSFTQHIHNPSRERNSAWGLLSCGKKGDVPAQLGEKGSAADSKKVLACSCRQQGCTENVGIWLQYEDAV